MQSAPPQLPAHKGLRGQILVELKCAQPLTAKQLADKLGVSANAVRHHLKELEAGSLIAYGREQRGVGAPTFAYRLSSAGEALFPRAYEATLTQLLERMAEKGGRPAAVELFEDHYRDLTRRAAARSGWQSTTARSARWRSGSPRYARPSSGSCGTSWGPRSSGALTSRAAATRANT